MKKIKLSKEKIDKLAEESINSVDLLIEFYRLAVPDFDKLKKIDKGWPTVNEETAKYLIEKLQVPDAGSGNMLWLNKGFSYDNTKGLKDFEVDLSNCEFIY